MATIENNQTVLRSSSEIERRRKFEAATNKVFERWHDVFVELAKGANDKDENYEKVNDESKKLK